MRSGEKNKQGYEIFSSGERNRKDSGSVAGPFEPIPTPGKLTQPPSPAEDLFADAAPPPPAAGLGERPDLWPADLRDEHRALTTDLLRRLYGITTDPRTGHYRGNDDTPPGACVSAAIAMSRAARDWLRLGTPLPTEPDPTLSPR